MACSDGRDSRLMKPPGILPAAYIRSSMSTVSGKKSRPGRGSERFAVPSTMVSPKRTVTEPPASVASLPVSMVSVRPPNWVSKTFDTGCDSSWSWRRRRPAAGRPAVGPCASGAGDAGSLEAGLAAESEPSDDGAVARGVLLHEIREKAAALADELEEAAAGVIVLGEASKMPRQLRDARRQERNLDFRGSGIAILDGVPGDDLLLRFGRQRHSFLRHERG